MGAGASLENQESFGPVVIGPDGRPRRMPRLMIRSLPQRAPYSRPRHLPMYFCHSCERSFTHTGRPPRENRPTLQEVSDNNSGIDNNSDNNSDNTTTTVNDDANSNTNDLLPGQVNSELSDTVVSSTTTSTDTTSNVEESVVNEVHNNSDSNNDDSNDGGGDEVRCPRCGGNFIEETSVQTHVHNHNHQNRAREERNSNVDEHQQIQFLLSILRQNILSQLEQAELNLALRESMETYKPNITPASQGAISNLERYELTEETLKTAQDPMCVICSEDFKVNDQVLNLPCKHLFHVECCEKWLQINNTCCVCREPIPEMKKDKDDDDTDVKDIKSGSAHVNAVNDTDVLANVNANTNDTTLNSTEEEVVEQIETSPRITFSTDGNSNNVINLGSLNHASVTNTVIHSGGDSGT